MLKKTHVAVGAAISLVILPPQSLEELFWGTGMAVVGSLISDIDAEASSSNKRMDRIVQIASLLVLVTGAIAVKENIDILGKIIEDHTNRKNVYAIAILLIVCAFGKEQPHRSFMHSFLSLAILYACVRQLFPVTASYFGVAFLTHLFIDFWNRKGLRLFYPWKKGFSLDFCSSDGLINKWLFNIGTCISAGLFLFYLCKNVL